MKFNICIIQPQGYIHSLAFLELAELLNYSLRELDHQSIIQFNKVDTSAKNIIVGFHLLDIKFASELPKNTVLINAEQFLGNTPWNENILNWIKSFEVWDYSTQNIAFFQKMGLKNIKHLQLGYQKELTRINKNVAQDIDVLFYGSINARRSKVLNDLEKSGLNIHKIFGIYSKKRDDLIARSKLVLNLHYYDSEIFEVVRVFYLLTNGITVIGEVNPSTDVDNLYKNAVISTQYSNIVATCIAKINDKQSRETNGERGFKLIRANPQIIYTAKMLL